jgi:hypothetical protein
VNCTACVGNCIYIDSNKLSSLIDTTSFSYSYSLKYENDLKGRIYNNDKNIEELIPLSFYLCPLGKARNGWELELELELEFDCDKRCSDCNEECFSYDERCFSCDDGCFEYLVCFYLFLIDIIIIIIIIIIIF